MSRNSFLPEGLGYNIEDGILEIFCDNELWEEVRDEFGHIKFKQIKKQEISNE